MLVGGQALEAVWPHVFNLCPHCAVAAAPTKSPTGALLNALLLPDRSATTFALNESSPLRYEQLRVPQRTFDPDSGITTDAGSRDAVIVVGTDDRARATIRHFALNTRFFDEATNSLVFSADLDLDSFDPRLNLRMQAWKSAARYARLLKDADEPLWHRTLLNQALMSLSYNGFWSVWATVLWEVLRDVSLLSDMLDADSPGGSFPRTRADWLPGLASGSGRNCHA
jgi:hypothetical protein